MANQKVEFPKRSVYARDRVQRDTFGWRSNQAVSLERNLTQVGRTLDAMQEVPFLTPETPASLQDAFTFGLITAGAEQILMQKATPDDPIIGKNKSPRQLRNSVEGEIIDAAHLGARRLYQQGTSSANKDQLANAYKAGQDLIKNQWVNVEPYQAEVTKIGYAIVPSPMSEIFYPWVSPRVKMYTYPDTQTAYRVKKESSKSTSK